MSYDGLKITIKRINLYHRTPGACEFPHWLRKHKDSLMPKLGHEVKIKIH